MIFGRWYVHSRLHSFETQWQSLKWQATQKVFKNDMICWLECKVSEMGKRGLEYLIMYISFGSDALPALPLKESGCGPREDD